ncbi:MAG: metallophosphoesterase family protein [Anaerolineae bacterium]
MWGYVRCLVIADVHANLAAFEAVLMAAGDFDEIWCLGDIVGYGPDPDECVALLRRYPHVAVAGNHDWAAIGRLDLYEFNPSARAAAEWTSSQLQPRSRRYLESLGICHKRDLFTLVHGSVRHPVWEYIDEPVVASENLDLLSTPYCLVGHTHVPLLYTKGLAATGPADELIIEGDRTTIMLGARPLILNPGSVGQPRDGDPRAAFALIDPDAGTVELRRVSYAVPTTQERIATVGLPHRNAARLALGL